MKYQILYFLCLCLGSCTMQGYLLHNSSDKDMIVTGPYERCPVVWGRGKGSPYGFFSRSHNCKAVISLDSIIPIKQYVSYIESLDDEQLITVISNNPPSSKNHVRILVQPNGYLPVASNKHFFFTSVKKSALHFKLLNPMIIITHNDSITLDKGLELKCPPQFQPDGYKEIEGMPVIIECK